jgi:hypothetical protein
MGLIKNILFCALCLVLSVPLHAADLDDLFDIQKLSKHLKATQAQKEAITTHIPKLTEIIGGYQLTRAKKLCEATLWQGHIPRIKTLRALRKTTLDSVDATIESLKEAAQFNEKQTKNLDKILKGNDNILDYPIAKHPYYHVVNSPIIKDFLREKHAYRITLPSQPNPNNSWTYAQLLETWTARGFIPTDLQTRVLPQGERARLVKSPLLISATLLVPDLAKAEFDLLKNNYAPDSIDVTTWDEYVSQNQMNDMIQVRLKLNTPFNEKYLDLSRWIIFLEDDEGVGYEPRQVNARAFYPLEAVEVSVPGQEIEVTDVFGQYFSPIPGEKERFYLEAPSRMTYVGNEKLLQLYFPGRDFQGSPIVDEKTKFLKLIVQSQETDFGRSELIWRIEKPQNKVRPPKG